MNSCEKGGGGGWLHAGFRLSTIETGRRFGVDKTCPLPKAFLSVAKGLLAGYGGGDFVRVNTLDVSRIDGRDHIKVSLTRQHAVVRVGGCRCRQGIQLLVRPARLCATVDVVADHRGKAGIPAQSACQRNRLDTRGGQRDGGRVGGIADQRDIAGGGAGGCGSKNHAADWSLPRRQGRTGRQSTGGGARPPAAGRPQCAPWRAASYEGQPFPR